MQSVIVEGHLAADPSVLSAQGDGRKRASFRLLETYKYKRADGEVVEQTTGFNCICFNEGVAENYIGAFARKGSRMVVHGHVEEDRWTGRDGTEHFDLKLIVGECRLKNRFDDEQERSGRRRMKPGMDTDPGQPRTREPFPAELDDEIPV